MQSLWVGGIGDCTGKIREPDTDERLQATRIFPGKGLAGGLSNNNIDRDERKKADLSGNGAGSHGGAGPVMSAEIICSERNHISLVLR